MKKRAAKHNAFGSVCVGLAAQVAPRRASAVWQRAKVRSTAGSLAPSAAPAAVAQGAVRRAVPQVSVKVESPSFSIEVTSLSPGFSHTCLSLG